MKRLGHVPALDGLRAVAIAFVVGYHAFRQPAGGWLGVDLFFVLSGFLITTLLLEERATEGRISLRRFYERRARRLLPALFVMLAAFTSCALIAGHFGARETAGVLASSFYLQNLAQAGLFETPKSLAHMWSLSAEEQFYLVWPLCSPGFS